MPTDDGSPGGVRAQGLTMPESPRWRDGELWFVDGPALRVLGADGSVRTVVQTDAPVLLGQWSAPGGATLVNDATGRRVLSISREGQVSVAADLSGETDFMLNEVCLLPDGGLLVGDIGFDALGGGAPRAVRLIYVAPDGRISRTGSPTLFANGMAMSPDGRELLVAESYAGGLWRYRPVAGQGVDAGERIMSRPGAVPDGVARAADGSLWFADIHSGEVVHVSARGEELERRPCGLPHATSCALTDDGGSLWITALASMPRLPFAKDGALIEIPLGDRA